MDQNDIFRKLSRPRKKNLSPPQVFKLTDFLQGPSRQKPIITPASFSGKLRRRGGYMLFKFCPSRPSRPLWQSRMQFYSTLHHQYKCLFLSFSSLQTSAHSVALSLRQLWLNQRITLYVNMPYATICICIIRMLTSLYNIPYATIYIYISIIRMLTTKV